MQLVRFFSTALYYFMHGSAGREKTKAEATIKKGLSYVASDNRK